MKAEEAVLRDRLSPGELGGSCKCHPLSWCSQAGEELQRTAASAGARFLCRPHLLSSKRQSQYKPPSLGSLWSSRSKKITRRSWPGGGNRRWKNNTENGRGGKGLTTKKKKIKTNKRECRGCDSTSFHHAMVERSSVCPSASPSQQGISANREAVRL